MSERIFGYQLITHFLVNDTKGGIEPVRQVKRQLRHGIEQELKNERKVADGDIAFRTYAQSGFNARELTYREYPWIVGTPLPEWAMLVRVEAEVHTV